MSFTYREVEQKWLQLNPIRQHRVKEGWRLKDVAAALDVGYHTIYRWENGMSMPGKEQTQKLAELMKNKKLAEELQEWKLQRPLLGK